MQYWTWRRIGPVLVMTAALGAGSACSQTSRDPALTPMDFSSRQTRAPGEYLVTLAAGADSRAVAELYGRYAIESIQGLGHNVFLLKLTEDPGPAKMEELRGRNTQIQAVQPNFVYRANKPGNIQ